MHTRRGAAFLEVLIVLIALGILTVVIVPQLSNAGTDPRVTVLRTNLETIRSRIQMYKMQHNDTLPALKTFAEQLTLASRLDGSTAAPGTAGYDLGPYLEAVPNNPYTSTNTVGAGPIGSSAWYYDAATGTFRANHHADYTGY